MRGDLKNAWLLRSAEAIRHESSSLLKANALDVAEAPEFGLSAAAIDRLTLDEKRIEAIARALEEVAGLPDPIGETIEAYRRPNGLDVSKIRVPLGVIFFIYESRPNVTADAAALCVKSGNAVILRGGKEALRSNLALHRVLAGTLESSALPAGAVQVVETADRAAVGRFLAMADRIDLVIPRGGEELIRRVASEAKMPVLKHFQGNCHVYVDAQVDEDSAIAVVLNSKVQRPGVCNAAETLLVHRDVAETFLPRVAAALVRAEVELRGDPRARSLFPSMIPATPEDWDAEYLDKILTDRHRQQSRRGDRPYRAPRLGAHRGDPHERSSDRAPVRRRGR